MFGGHGLAIYPYLQDRPRPAVGEPALRRRAAIGQGLPARFQFLVQVTPGQGLGHIDGFGQMVDVGLGAGPVEQRLVPAQRVEGIEAGKRRGGRGVAALHGVGLQPPQEEGDVGQVVATGGQRAHVGGVQLGAERAVDTLHGARMAQVGRAQRVRTRMIHMLRGGDPLETLRDAAAPAGGVGGQFFQHQRRAFAPAQP
ncbi:hypothetical protein D3C85_1119980 [compost metagenome]